MSLEGYGADLQANACSQMADGQNRRSDYSHLLQSLHAVTNYSQCHHHFVPQMITSCADQIMVSQLNESRTRSFQITQPEFTVCITHTTDNIIHTKLSLQKAFSPKHQEELSIHRSGGRIYLLQGRLSVLTLISVSVPPPCYHSST